MINHIEIPIQSSQPELRHQDIGVTIESNKMVINKFNTKMINHLEIPNQTRTNHPAKQRVRPSGTQTD